MLNSDFAYRWVITTLVGLLCFSIGYAMSSTASTRELRDTVVRNTVRIDKLEQNMESINKKLDLILMRVQ